MSSQHLARIWSSVTSLRAFLVKIRMQGAEEETRKPAIRRRCGLRLYNGCEGGETES